MSAPTAQSPAPSQSPAPPRSASPTGNAAGAGGPSAASALGGANLPDGSGGAGAALGPGQMSVSSRLKARERLESDRIVFRIYKGVKTFTFSDAKNLLVTGGMDRIVRSAHIRNPFHILFSFVIRTSIVRK